MLIVIFLIVGAVAGFLSGMFGIGGGLVIVPVLLSCFHFMDVAPTVAMHLALGTSLATIITTTSVSAYVHYQKNGLDLTILWRLALGLLIGAILGGQLAGELSSEHLQSLLAGFLLVMATYMLLGKPPKSSSFSAPPLVLSLVGILIGALAALFGVGGGVLMTPLLTLLGLDIKKAVGMSAAGGVVVALTGSLSYATTGWGHPDLPMWSLGYVYLPAYLGMALMSPWFVKIGAKLTYAMDPHRLKQIFALLLFVTAVRLF